MIGVRSWAVLDEVDSTNDEVRRQLEAGAAHGCAVLARRQRAGRGRHGRRWVTAGEANLHLSVGLRHPLLVRHTGLVPLVAGVAVARALDPDAAHGVGLKWPNDIVVGERKLGGILCEGLPGRSGVEAVVVGVGINLAGDRDMLPAEIGGGAVTWSEVTGGAWPLEATAQRIRQEMLEGVDALVSAPSTVRSAWSALDVLRGTWVKAQVGGVGVEGRAAGIAEDGALLLETMEGAVVRVVSGEVTRVRRADSGGSAEGD
ncbi:MAG: biotin--[acetyl-CoA-carboxylase] ligase [Deltaproteobacteria bacterium]|nr:MAG: biotin--[acetyl-CoA-carboxylase] ligase [Deltaproteobacteria bacterium]